MPTLDARAHREAGLPRPERAGNEAYAVRKAEPAVHEILRLIAAADAVLATGHLSVQETAWVVRTAREIGVRRIVLTHASFTLPGMTAAEACELADLGAFAEVTAFQLLHQDGCEAADLASFIRAVGVRRCVLSSDAGQPDSPRAPEALELLVDALARERLDRGALEAMASEVPERLILP
jgi:hypothetical protein